MASSNSAEPPFEADDAGDIPPWPAGGSESGVPLRYADDDHVPATIPHYPVTIIEPPPYFEAEGSRRRRRAWGRPWVLALAVAFGVVVGVFVSDAVGWKLFGTGTASDGSAPIRESIDSLAGELSALKTTIAASRRDSEAKLADLADRFARVENAQDGLGSKLTALAATNAGQAAAPSPEVTGSIKPADGLPVARGWILWRVTNGRAVIEHRGRYYEVEPGSDIPGLGMVETIDRKSGQWRVVTRGGVIHQPKG